MTALATKNWARRMLSVGAPLAIAACGGGHSPAPAPPPPPPASPVTVNGVVSDGPVEGGMIFVFGADRVQGALEAVTPDGNRQATLAGANPLASVQRDGEDEDRFEIAVPGERAGEPVFLLFDNAGAEDQAFGDAPPNLESVAILDDAGATQRLNLTLHTTLISQYVRAQLDPDGDGTPIGASAIQSAIQAAQMNVVTALGMDDLDRNLFPNGEHPLDSGEDDVVHDASSFIGLLARAAASAEGLGLDEVIQALAADAGDGRIDGAIPVSFGSGPEFQAMAAAVAAFASPDDGDFSRFAVGPCSSSAVALRRACAVDVVDNRFEGRAVCADIADETARDACLAEVESGAEEDGEECGDVFDARLELCADLSDAAHEPAFGAAYAASFVDPAAIGTTVQPHAYWPLVAGNEWVYEGTSIDDDGEEVTETISVTVTDRTKLIDGVTCVVVVDVAMEEDAVIESTDDWYAQDVDGNVWYCGEISQNFEVFDGDDPEEPELTDTEGSWKAGRDGAKAGILLPASPDPGQVIRQEISWGDAEDVVKILSTTATESAPGGACVENCLLTADYTPLDPGVEENKYYAPGVGLIVEVDLETGDRVELIQFSND